jgi:hypothetical protein
MSSEIPLEEDEAVTLADWLRVHKIPHTHVDNEGKMKVTYMKKQARQGKSAGFPDYVIYLPTHLLQIELKRRAKTTKTGKRSTSHTKVSPAQQDWIDTINCYDYAEAIVCYGATEAIEAIKERMGMK